MGAPFTGASIYNKPKEAAAPAPAPTVLASAGASAAAAATAATDAAQVLISLSAQQGEREGQGQGEGQGKGEEGEEAAAQKRKPIVDAFVKQQFNPKDLERLSQHPKLRAAMEAAGREMGVDADLLVHTIKNAGPLAAQLHATFQPIPQHHKKADTGRKEEGRDGRAFTVLGERKNTAKILNSEEGLERLARLEEEKQQQAGEGEKKGAAISRVKGMLREARIIDNDALLSNKKPTKEVLRRFINT